MCVPHLVEFGLRIVARTSMSDRLFVRFSEKSGVSLWLKIFVVSGSICANFVSLRVCFSACFAPSIRGVLVSLNSSGAWVVGLCWFW